MSTGITNLISYETLGTKEEFAGWVSNLSPYETPFVSLTGKSPVNNRVFEWQTDRLNNVVSDNAWPADTSVLPDPIQPVTVLHNNYTQILRKYVEVSDTVDALVAHGRPSELEYQIEKATKEMKRDLETILLSTQKKDDGSTSKVRLTSAFYDLVSGLDEKDPETGAITHKKLDVGTFTEEALFDITENLYMAGSRANVIMYHPIHAKTFSEMFEKHGSGRKMVFDNEDTKVSYYVNEITDPLGQVYTLVPNQWMDQYMVYFFHPHDWFQRVLRAPVANSLDKTGSSDSWMLEMEVGLQHRHPFASGILELTYIQPDYKIIINPIPNQWVGDKTYQATASFQNGYPTKQSWSVDNTDVATIDSTTGLITFKSGGSVSVSLTGEYYRGVTVSSEAPVTFTLTPTAKYSSKSSLALKVTDKVSLKGYLVVSPMQAESLGYTYELVSNTGDAITLNTTTGEVTGMNAGYEATVKITSKADPAIYNNVRISVIVGNHTVTLNPDLATDPGMFVKDTLTVRVVLQDALASDDDITMDSFDPTGLTITKKAIGSNKRQYEFDITANEVGLEAIIFNAYYADGPFSQGFLLDVKDYDVSINPLTDVIATNKITAVMTEASGKVPESVVWSVVPDTVATVNASTGEITFKEVGSFQVNVEASFNSNKVARVGSQVVSVSAPNLTWKVAPSSAIKNDVQNVEVQSSGTLTGATIVWETSNHDIATVVGSGTTAAITYHEKGDVTITATWSYDGSPAIASQLVTVGDIVINKSTNLINLSVGQSIDLNTIFSTTPLDAASSGFTYSILSGDTASVTLQGSTLTGVSPSQENIVIQAVLNGKAVTPSTVEAAVTVLFNTKLTSSTQTIESGRYQVTQGDTYNISVTFTPTSGWRANSYNWFINSSRVGRIVGGGGFSDTFVSLNTDYKILTDLDGSPMSKSSYPFNTNHNEISCIVNFHNDITGENQDVTVEFPAHYKFDNFTTLR